MSAIRKRSIVIDGHRTSVSLEPQFWDMLKYIAERERKPVSQIVTQINKKRPNSANLSSSIRLFVLNFALSS